MVWIWLGFALRIRAQDAAHYQKGEAQNIPSSDEKYKAQTRSSYKSINMTTRNMKIFVFLV